MLTNEKLEKWYVLQDQLKTIRDEEAALRAEIFAEAFPNAKEGTNKFDLGEGYQLTATLPVSRKVDIAVFEAMKDLLAENGINADKMVKWNPELEMKQYRCLTEEELHLVDQFLIIKDGSPQMKIIAPKKKVS